MNRMRRIWTSLIPGHFIHFLYLLNWLFVVIFCCYLPQSALADDARVQVKFGPNESVSIFMSPSQKRRLFDLHEKFCTPKGGSLSSCTEMIELARSVGHKDFEYDGYIRGCIKGEPEYCLSYIRNSTSSLNLSTYPCSSEKIRSCIMNAHVAFRVASRDGTESSKRLSKATKLRYLEALRSALRVVEIRCSESKDGRLCFESASLLSKEGSYFEAEEYQGRNPFLDTRKEVLGIGCRLGSVHSCDLQSAEK